MFPEAGWMWIASERETMGTSGRAPKLQRERTREWSAGRAKHSRCNRQAGQAHGEVSELRYYGLLLSIGLRTLVLIRRHGRKAQPPVQTDDKKSMREEVGDAGLTAGLTAGHDKSKTFRW
ncbi:hypothetical protein ACQKWADRAFT_324036 [Trichoderma austrokoningii]